jgi:hypothetical protein
MPAVAATTTKLSALVEAARSVQVRGRDGTACTGLACFLACRPWMTLARMRARDARSMDDTLRRDLKLASLPASATSYVLLVLPARTQERPAHSQHFASGGSHQALPTRRPAQCFQS